MRVLLIQPRIDEFVKARVFPLGLAYLATYKASCSTNFEFKILDQQFDEEETVDSILQSFKPHVVGISLVSRAFEYGIALARTIRAFDHRITIMAGGIHPTVLPDLTLKAGFDIVIRAEGEHTFSELLDYLYDGRGMEGVTGISYMAPDGSIRHNPDRDLITDLDALPFPYTQLTPNPGRYHLIGVSPSRGCPMRCIYCCNTVLNRFRIRHRSPASFVGEIEYLTHTHGIRNYHFVDDQFTANPRRAEEICDLIIEKKLNISWYTLSRTDTPTPKLLAKMKAAGCETLSFGVESGSQSILDRMKKRVSLKKAADAIRMTQAAGIRCRTTWIVGFPGTFEEQLQSIAFMEDALPDEIVVFKLSVYPGTALWANAEKFGIHLPRMKNGEIDYNAINWKHDFELTEFGNDYLTHDQLFGIANKMTDTMKKHGYISSLDHTDGILRDRRIIRTYLDEPYEKKERPVMDAS